MAGTENLPAKDGDLLAEYAAVLAHLQHFPEHNGEVLRRLKKSPEEWQRTESDSKAALLTAVRADDDETLVRFGTVFASTKRLLAEKKAKLDDIGAAEPSSPALKLTPATAPSATEPVAPLAAPYAPRLTPIPMPMMPPPGAPVFQPRLSLHQYASLRAEVMQANPQGLGEVRARYGLDEETDAQEAQAWARQFASDPALFERYKGLFQYFRGMVRGSGGA